jgi:plastocyanin
MRQLSFLSIVLLLLGLLPAALPEGSAPGTTAEVQPATPAPAQPARTLTALVGVGQDTTQVLAFFPAALKVRVGDTITWKIESDEVHTVSFIRGVTPQEATMQDPLGGPGDLIPTFYARWTPGGAAEDSTIHPQVFFPTRAEGAPVEKYSGTGFVSSGIMKKRPPPGATPNLTFSVTFDKPGTYPFLCLVHPDRMRGTVEVVSASTTDVPAQAQIDAQAQVESAPLLALVQKAKDQGRMGRSEPGPKGTTLWFVRAGNSDWFSGDPRSQVFDFLPKAVTIKAGDTVVWASTYFHTITFNPMPPPPEDIVARPQPQGQPTMLLNPKATTPARPGPVFDPAQYFNSADLGPFSISGSSWALTFDAPGTFSYFCVFHRELGMEGTIIVQQREARSQ